MTSKTSPTQKWDRKTLVLLVVMCSKSKTKLLSSSPAYWEMHSEPAKQRQPQQPREQQRLEGEAHRNCPEHELLDSRFGGQCRRNPPLVVVLGEEGQPRTGGHSERAIRDYRVRHMHHQPVRTQRGNQLYRSLQPIGN